jgi:(heptosyl)LPS beta-1,4-glucosyltransferase
MIKLSVVIITFNEERNIKRCLDSVIDIADEIIVIDSFSNDKTQEIAESYQNIHFIQRKWEGYSASKNYANNLAQNDYIFSIDADEEVSPTLKEAILKEKILGFSGIYTLNRLTNYCSKWIHHSGWYPDFKIRIFPKNKTQWVGEFVHEELEFSEKMNNKMLEGDLFHYSYYDHQDHRARADKYSLLTAAKMNKKGKKASVLKPYLSAFVRFISMFIFKKGFLDGKAGLKIAQISALSNVVKYKELRRLNRER